MKRSLVFCRRNTLEMLRDPLMYVFCIAFPVILLAMFAFINSFSNGNTPTFLPCALAPGVAVFSFTFVMLNGTLLVSKDKSTAFILRLYTSPMKTHDFVIGYFLPLFAVGVVQCIVCIATAAIIAAITGAAFFSFGAAMLLMLAMLPVLIISIFLGILFGTVFNDKSAPGLISIIISAAGILGGCWMPLETMGGFETFCRFLPFYPSVYLGRAVTGAVDSFGAVYTLAGGWWIFVSIFVYLAAAVGASLFAFYKKSNAD